MTGSQNIKKIKSYDFTENGLEIKLRKQGRVCTLTVNGGHINKTIPYNSALFNLPVEYRPFSWQPVPDQSTGRSGVSTTSLYYAVTASGPVTASQQVGNGTYVRFTVTYITTI